MRIFNLLRYFKLDNFLRKSLIIPVLLVFVFVVLLLLLLVFRYSIFRCMNKEANLGVLSYRLKNEPVRFQFLATQNWTRHAPCYSIMDCALVNGWASSPRPDSSELDVWRRENSSFVIESFRSPLQIDFVDNRSLRIVAGSLCNDYRVEYVLTEIDSGKFAYLDVHAEDRTQVGFGLDYDTAVLTKESVFHGIKNGKWEFTEINHSDLSRIFLPPLVWVMRKTMLRSDSVVSCINEGARYSRD